MAAGVFAAPVLPVGAALLHPRTVHRGMVIEMEGATADWARRSG